METTPQYYHNILSHTHYHKDYHNFVRNSQKKNNNNKKKTKKKKKKKKTVALSKSGHYSIVRTLALCEDSSRDSTDELAGAYDPKDEATNDSDPEDSTKRKGCLRRVDTIPFHER